MARKTREREDLEKLSADVQKIFHLVAIKECCYAFVGLTVNIVTYFLILQRGKVILETDIPALIQGVKQALLLLQQEDFLQSEKRDQGTIYFLTRKGERAFV